MLAFGRTPTRQNMICRFDLYFQQNYAPDCEEWRKREPLMEWP
jgi:hypothetical protein